MKTNDSARRPAAPPNGVRPEKDEAPAPARLAACIIALALGCAAAGCTGSIDGQSGGGSERPGDEAPGPGGAGTGGAPAAGGSGGERPTAKPPAGVTSAAPARMRRLTPDELRNSLRDVFLGGTTPVTDELPSDSTRHTFDTDFEALGVSSDFAISWQGVSEKVAALAVKDVKRLAPCAPAQAGPATPAEETCAGQFVDAYGLRAFRRPVTADERTRLLRVYSEARKGTDFATSVAAVIEALVQSPNFLYRFELGAGSGKIVALTHFEVASALSYALWRSAPDDALLAAAKEGKLGTRPEIAAQAKRMLADARGKEGLRSFLVQWLDLIDPESLSKADPAFNTALAKSMAAETHRFVDDVIGARDANLKTLLTSTDTFGDAQVAKLYGVPAPAGGGVGKLSVDKTRRSGFLTQPAFLASHTPGGGFSPIFLGRFFRVAMFCRALPPPPPAIPPLPEDRNLTTRQRFAQHSSSPACSGCHKLMDPIGWGFEQFDPLGRFAPMEGTKALTGAGELAETDVDGPFSGPVELGAKLAASAQVRDCFAAQLLKYVLGRDTRTSELRLPIDEASLAAARDAFEGGDMKALATALLTTDSFLFRDASRLTMGGN